jgi:two-component system NtrC family sensor kinase
LTIINEPQSPLKARFILHFSLITKIAIATSIVLLVCMIVFTQLNFNNLKKMMIEEAVADSDRLSETIISSTHNQMLENNLFGVFQMIREIGKQKDVLHIRLISKTGRIIYSTDENEIGELVDKKAEACNMCHASETPQLDASSMNRSRFFTDTNGQEVLGLAKAIYNSEKCYTAACHFHPESFKVLGVLDVITSLQPMRELMDSYRYKLGAVTFLIIAALWVSITFFMMIFVNRPIKQLLHQIRLMSQGELDGILPTFSSYELAILSESFNKMTLNLRKARSELEDWAHTLELRVEERTNELKQVQTQLVRSEKLASLGELVAGIAHEINNPLTGILMYASLVQHDDRLNPVFKSDIAIIVRETERCARIVSGLLDFSREKSPKKKISSITAIMDATLSLVKSQSIFLNVKIRTDYSTKMPDISVDPNLIEQVFVNMVLNAGQAMPDGGNLDITICLQDSKENIVVSISDTGYGISEENLKKIFDPFFTTKENKGTGLGLSVSYGIIESHGGEIEVYSEQGKGTRFTILLPVKNEDEKITPGF